MSLYLDELQFTLEFRSGRITLSGQLKIWTKNTSSRATAQPNIIRPEQNSNLNCNSSRYSHIPNIKSNKVRILFRLNDFWQSYGHWTYIFFSNFKLSVIFFDVLWYIDLIFDMLLYLPNIKSNISKDVKKKYGQLKIWTKNTSSMYITQPKVIRPEPNYFKLSVLFFDVLWYIDLIFDMLLYLDELQFKFEFRSGRMIFGWVMSLELVFFHIPNIKSIYIRTSKKGPDNLKFEQKIQVQEP
jgi:hypothetical protein